MRHTEKIEGELRITTEKYQFLSKQLEESQFRHKHLIAALEKDNMELRMAREAFEKDAVTKQKEIHDLITIVASLEEKDKVASATTTALKDANIKQTQKIKELEAQTV